VASKIVLRPTKKKGLVFVTTDGQSAPPTITLPDGTVITAVKADQVGGVFANNESGKTEYQWAFPNFNAYGQPVTVSFAGQSKPLSVDFNTEWRTESGGIQGLDQAPNKDLRSGGFPGQFTPGQVGQFGFFPGYQQFPNPFLSPLADYNFTDAMDYAKKFGNFSRKELTKNFNLAQDMALSQLDTELEGMQNFVPVASALKRQQTSIDNYFNQAERTRQIDTALPELRGDLAAQGDRARTFASGRFTSDIEDRGYEIGSRSAAADQSTQGGFGASSSVARKASDLLSADRRFQLSQYGDQLTTQNAQTRSTIELAPTSYSNAGQQINVMPSVSASQLGSQNFQNVNQYSSIPATTALQNTIQQNQYRTSQVQGVNNLNTATQNQFALQKFGYDAGYANMIAGAYQTETNTQFQIEQQKRYEDLVKNYADKAQDSNTIKDIISGLSSLGSLLFGDSFGSGGTDGTIGAGAIDEGDALGSSSSRANPSDIFGAPSDFDTGEIGSDSISAGDTLGQEGGTPADIFTQTALKTKQGLIKTRQAQDAYAKNYNASLGISNTPQKGFIPAGYDTKGKPVFMKASLAQNNDAALGAKQTTTLGNMLKGMGVLNNTEDEETFNEIANIASNAALVASLGEKVVNKDFKGFANLLAKTFKKDAAEFLTDNAQDAAGVEAGISAAQLFTMWDRLSPAQKSLGLANLGLKGYQFATGNNLATQPIIEGSKGIPGLNVGQALQLMQNGYNVYALIDNWDQMNTFNKITGGVTTAAGIASTAQTLGLIGNTAANAATTGAAVTGASIGANVGANAAANTGAGIGTTIGEGVMAAAPYAAIAAGVYTVAKGWGEGGTKGALNGAIGAAGISAGLYALSVTNPYVFAAVAATSIIGNAVKKGKSGDQKARDQVRNRFVELGLSDKDGKFTLPDGTQVSIGVDGHGGYHDATNPDALTGERKGKKQLNAWDIDYTNDLDYSAGMAGIALSRIAGGGVTKAIDQLGNQIGNAALGNIGYNKQMTKENYNKMIENMRAIYAQSGITSKDMAYALAQKAFDEGRLNATDFVTAQQAFNMIYDPNSYDTAQRLMNGRNRGIEVAESDENENLDTGKDGRRLIKTDGRGGRQNIKPTGKMNKQAPRRRDARDETDLPADLRDGIDDVFSDARNRGSGYGRANSGSNLTKDQLRIRNSGRYGAGQEIYGI